MPIFFADAGDGTTADRPHTTFFAAARRNGREPATHRDAEAAGRSAPGHGAQMPTTSPCLRTTYASVRRTRP